MQGTGERRRTPRTGGPGGIDALHRRYGSVQARAHCCFPGCGKTLPNRLVRSGACDYHRAAVSAEKKRLRQAQYRVKKATREGRMLRPRPPKTEESAR